MIKFYNYLSDIHMRFACDFFLLAIVFLDLCFKISTTSLRKNFLGQEN